MLVSSIAGIDNVRVDAVSQKLSGSGCRMPDNHHVDSHGFQVSRRIDERLALRDARARRCDVDRIGAETLLCKLERDPRSRRALEEKIDNGGPAKRRHFLDRSFADFLERLGGVQNQEDLLARKKFESQQVLAERARHGACSPDSGTMTTAVLPSRSRSEEHTSELQSLAYLVCRLLLEKKKKKRIIIRKKQIKKNKIKNQIITINNNKYE